MEFIWKIVRLERIGSENILEFLKFLQTELRPLSYMARIFKGQKVLEKIMSKFVKNVLLPNSLLLHLISARWKCDLFGLFDRKKAHPQKV